MHIESAESVEKGSVKVRKGHKVTGILLSILGSLWLARKTGWMPNETDLVPHHATGGIFLPVVLIASGLLLVFGLMGRGRKQSK
jgi:hypothetical protein